MKKLRFALLACTSLLLVSILLIKGFMGHAAHAAPASKATPASACQWSVVASPNVGSKTNDTLNGVAAITANDVWAVGDYTKPDGALLTLAEHWDGSAWSIVPTPNLHIGGTFLESVSSDATNDVWAVGASERVRSSYNTFVEHWDGTQWNIISSPNVGTNDVLYGVAALAPDNVWAVGEYNNGDNVLIEHWDGTQWSVVPGVNPGNVNNSFYSVTAISANDIWAVGFTSSTSSVHEQTLIEHWNGTQWSRVSSPNVPKIGNFLLSVSASATNNVWAVGYLVSNQQTLTERWDGTKWSLVPGIPAHSGSYVQFNGVVALSTNNVWAAGYADTERQTLIGRWNGTKWNAVSSPSPGMQGNVLKGITSVPSTNQLWSVGFTYNTSGLVQTLIERYC